MRNPKVAVKWKYIAFVIICSLFLYFFANYSILRPSPLNIHTKEYCIGVLLLVVYFVNAFVLHPLFYQQNRTVAYAVGSVISVLLAIVVEFSWLYSDIMSCIPDVLTSKEAHSYYWGCVWFATLRDSGLLAFTFLLCEFHRSREEGKNTEALLLKSGDQILVKDSARNTILLNYKTIRYCEQEQNVTKIYGKEDNIYFRYGSLKKFKNLFDSEHFIQINRNTLVASRLITAYSDGQLWLDSEKSPFEVSSSFLEQENLRALIPKLDSTSESARGAKQNKTPILENKKTARVLQLITDNPIISAVRLSEITRLSQSTINRILLQLKAEKLVEYVGSKKSGGYRAVGAQTVASETAEHGDREGMAKKEASFKSASLNHV